MTTATILHKYQHKYLKIEISKNSIIDILRSTISFKDYNIQFFSFFTLYAIKPSIFSFLKPKKKSSTLKCFHHQEYFLLE